MTMRKILASMAIGAIAMVIACGAFVLFATLPDHVLKSVLTPISIAVGLFACFAVGSEILEWWND